MTSPLPIGVCFLRVVCGCVALWGSLCAPACAEEKTAAAWVEQLGHEEYDRREEASRALEQFGPAAFAALDAARDSANAEIRYRVAAVRSRILAERAAADLQAKEQNLRRQLRTLVEQPQQEVTLAGWSVYREAVGDTPESRKFFAEVMEAFGPVWLSLPAEPAQATKQFREWSLARHEARQNSEEAPPADALCRESAFLTIIARLPAIQLDADAKQELADWAFDPFLTAERISQPLAVKLYLKYLETAEDEMLLANGIESLVAVEWGRARPSVQQALRSWATDPRFSAEQVRAYAVSAYGQLGIRTPADRQWLEKMLADDAKVGEQTFDPLPGTKGPPVVSHAQLRDIALFHLVQSQIKSRTRFKDFGFAFAQTKQTADDVSYDPTALGFVNDSARAAAFKKWRDDPPPPPTKTNKKKS